MTSDQTVLYLKLLISKYLQGQWLYSQLHSKPLSGSQLQSVHLELLLLKEVMLNLLKDFRNLQAEGEGVQNLDYKLAWIQSLDYSVDILAAEILHQIGINQNTLCVDLVLSSFFSSVCVHKLFIIHSYIKAVMQSNEDNPHL